MCIMEVRVGQRNSTISQACAHNTGTVIGDLELFKRLLEARHTAPEQMARVAQLHADLERVYNDACDLFGEFVAEEVAHHHHHDDDEIGAERTMEHVAAAEEARRIAEADLRRARKYETR